LYPLLYPLLLPLLPLLLLGALVEVTPVVWANRATLGPLPMLLLLLPA
jgi:hypothetical protein